MANPGRTSFFAPLRHGQWRSDSVATAGTHCVRFEPRRVPGPTQVESVRPEGRVLFLRIFQSLRRIFQVAARRVFVLGHQKAV